MKAGAIGIRAIVENTVTVYERKRGNLQFSKGVPLAVRCSFFDVVTERVVVNGAPLIRTRRVKRERTS